jgi:hypothetical protein
VQHVIILKERVIICDVVGYRFHAIVANPPILVYRLELREQWVMQLDFGGHIGALAVWFFGNFLATYGTFAVNNYAPPYYSNI